MASHPKAAPLNGLNDAWSNIPSKVTLSTASQLQDEHHVSSNGTSSRSALEAYAGLPANWGRILTPVPATRPNNSTQTSTLVPQLSDFPVEFASHAIKVKQEPESAFSLKSKVNLSHQIGSASPAETRPNTTSWSAVSSTPDDAAQSGALRSAALEPSADTNSTLSRQMPERTNSGSGVISRNAPRGQGEHPDLSIKNAAEAKYKARSFFSTDCLVLTKGDVIQALLPSRENHRAIEASDVYADLESFIRSDRERNFPRLNSLLKKVAEAHGDGYMLKEKYGGCKFCCDRFRTHRIPCSAPDACIRMFRTERAACQHGRRAGAELHYPKHRGCPYSAK